MAPAFAPILSCMGIIASSTASTQSMEPGFFEGIIITVSLKL